MSKFDLDDRHVLVTGAGRGLGRAMALACAAAGARVSLVARTAAQLDDTVAAVTAAGGTATAHVFNLGQLDEIEDWVAGIDVVDPISGIVHAAGIQVRKPAVEFTAHELTTVLTINLEVPFLLSTAVARRQLARNSRGSHVFIGSLASSIGLPNASAYTASKSGVVGAVRALATEWADSGIRVNGIGPGYFHTALTADLLAQEGQEARLLSRIPMKRLGNPDDLGGPVVFLLSDASGYITGQMLNVDGGWLAS